MTQEILRQILIFWYHIDHWIPGFQNPCVLLSFTHALKNTAAVYFNHGFTVVIIYIKLRPVAQVHGQSDTGNIARNKKQAM